MYVLTNKSKRESAQINKLIITRHLIIIIYAEENM